MSFIDKVKGKLRGKMREAERKIRKQRKRLEAELERQLDDAEQLVEKTGRELSRIGGDVKHATGIDFNPIVKSLAGPVHILAKIAEGHNASEAITDWVVNSVDGTGEIAGVFGSDFEEFARSVASWSSVPILLLVNATSDTVEVIEGGENFEDLVGSPLKSLILKAHGLYDDHAEPIPFSVKQTLLGIVDVEVLKRARFVVDAGPDNVAGWANLLRQKGGRNHAVVVDEIIVFARMPKDDLAGLLLWVHELEHVRQYEEWGVLEFAARYTKDFEEVEAEATAAAASALPVLQALIDEVS